MGTVWQTMKTEMKCRIMRHFIRVCTVSEDKIDLQRKKYNILFEIITVDPSIHPMDHLDFIECSFMGKPIGLKRVK